MKKLIIVFTIFYFAFFITVSFGATHESLEEKYYKQFEMVETEAVIYLEQLLEEATIEYLTYKKQDKNTYCLLIKYMKKGRKLEKEVDKKFYSLLNELKDDLKRQNLTVDLASSYENHYKTMKQGHIRNVYRLFIDN